MSESYTSGGDTLFTIDNPNLQGETFRPLERHTLEFIDLEMRGGMVINQPVIQVFLADVYHEPYGNSLSRDRYIVERHCTPFKTGRVRFSMIPYDLTPDFYYAIIAGNYPPLGGTSAHWQYNAGAGTYPRGHRISSPDHGTTWTQHYNDDCMFAEFGTPPAPPPPPPPPISHFAILNATFEHWLYAITITLPTNVPCHLTCYYTDKQPLKHHTTRTIRGLKVPWGTYFCFVGWKSVEQTEPGDTLYHTFEIPDWQECQTKWFIFRGEVDLIPSPSVGPIFMHHHPGPQTHLFEHYITGDDDDTGAAGRDWWWFGQTFTPSHSHVVNMVKLLLGRSGAPGTVTVSIRATHLNKPFGPDLCLGTINGNLLPLRPTYEWTEILLGEGTLLSTEIKYAICVRSQGSLFEDRVEARLDETVPTYTRGQYVTSQDSGNTWILNPSDLMFEEWFIA